MKVKLLPQQTIFTKPPPTAPGSASGESLTTQEQYFPLRVLPIKKPQKKSPTKPADPLKKLRNLISQSNTVLCRVKSLFPFDLFPDELTVEPTKITIILREFFFSENVFSIPIKNVSDILLETGPFFATLKIIDRSFSENEVNIRFLKKHEAVKARRIIQGLIIASTEEIDLSQVDYKTLLDHAERLGNAKGYKLDLGV